MEGVAHCMGHIVVACASIASGDVEVEPIPRGNINVMSTLFEACVAGSGLLKQQSSRQLCLTVAEVPMQTGCWRLVFYFFSRQCRGARHVAQQFILCFSFL